MIIPAIYAKNSTNWAACTPNIKVYTVVGGIQLRDSNCLSYMASMALMAFTVYKLASLT